MWRMNHWRVEELGLPPMQVSSTLSRSAQDYATFLAEHPEAGYGHVSDGRTPSQRAAAAGWPGSMGLSENIGINESAHQTFYYWWAEGPGDDFEAHGHYLNMADAANTVVGVGRDGDSWVADFGTSCAQPQCGMTGQYGSPPALLSPHLVLDRPYAQRRVVTVAAEVELEDRGFLTVTISQGAFKRVIRTRDRSFEKRVRLPKAGLYTVIAAYRADTPVVSWTNGNYADQTLPPRRVRVR